MIFSNNREAFRQYFYTAWQKHLSRSLIEPLEAQLIEIMIEHPEYHAFLTPNESCEQHDFPPEDNPFLHMALHLSVREQLHTNRPQGITQIYQALIAQYVEQHYVEHLMMGCLAHIIQKSQRNGVAASDAEYLDELKRI